MILNYTLLIGVYAMLSLTPAIGEKKTVKLEKGISAWNYGYSDANAEKILEFNKKALPNLRFKYLFPYGGSLGFNPKTRTAEIWYNSEKNSNRFAEKLPELHMMPIIDARADKGEFNGWSDEEYRRAALQTAEVIINDRNAAGVQIDIEPFHPDHLPYYRNLKEALNKKGKYCTMFVGNKHPDLMRKIFQSCDIVILSGYDVNGDGTPLKKYRKAFKGAITRLDKIAKETKGKYMVGIPAAASWGEWEYIVDSKGKIIKRSGFKQEEYVKVCLDIVKNYKGSPEFLGLSLWQLSVGEKDEPLKVKKETKFPNYIRESIWERLEKY
jgi:hypothetical protein